MPATVGDDREPRSAETQGVPHPGGHEHWSVVPDADRYQVSDLGRVATVATGRMLWQLVDTAGFCTVRMPAASGRWVHLVHLLVADAFVPNPRQHPEVRHLDGIRTHNQAANLARGTTQDLENDALRAAWAARIAAADALGAEARALLEDWERMRVVALPAEAFRPSLSDPWPAPAPLDPGAALDHGADGVDSGAAAESAATTPDLGGTDVRRPRSPARRDEAP
jgi:hypothetical protein